MKERTEDFSSTMRPQLKGYQLCPVRWQQPAYTVTFTVTVLVLPPASVTVIFTVYFLCAV